MPDAERIEQYAERAKALGWSPRQTMMAYAYGEVSPEFREATAKAAAFTARMDAVLAERPVIRTYTNLHVTSLNPEQHERTCNYWYTVTAGAMAHTAFTTRPGLMRWLTERGLSLKNGLPNTRVFGSSPVLGTYHERSYLDDADEFERLHPILATAVLSNGCYTLGLITEDARGERTVHSLNPNVKSRYVFEHWRTRQLMS